MQTPVSSVDMQQQQRSSAQPSSVLLLSCQRSADTSHKLFADCCKVQCPLKQSYNNAALLTLVNGPTPCMMAYAAFMGESHQQQHNTQPEDTLDAAAQNRLPHKQLIQQVRQQLTLTGQTGSIESSLRWLYLSTFSREWTWDSDVK